MLKGSTLLLYGLVLLFLGLLGGDAAKVHMDVDSEVQAGMEFEVRVSIDKGDIPSFTRFQAKLPYGLTAVSGVAENANFTFDGQEAKFIWLRLPSSPQLQVSYRVRVDERLKGQFNLGGTFSYIEDNSRRDVELPEARISIRGSSSVPVDRQLDVEAYQESIPAQRNLDLRTMRVRCVRAPLAPIPGSADTEVKLFVRRGEAEKFAKISERLPSGFTAEPIESKDAIFASENGEVRFLWMNLPPEPQFQVAYRLIPLTADAQVPSLQGEFSFLHDNVTRTFRITQSAVNPEGLDSEMLSALFHEAGVSHSGSKGQSGDIILDGPSAGGVDLPVSYREVQPIRPSVDPSVSSMRKRKAMMERYMLTPEEGIYYRVQVAAGHKPIDINRYFKRLLLRADVRTERHDGWYKYSVGSFTSYRDARDYRMKVWETTPISDAFVAAYNNGHRITVQEALMITSQRWYK